MLTQVHRAGASARQPVRRPGHPVSFMGSRHLAGSAPGAALLPAQSPQVRPDAALLNAYALGKAQIAAPRVRPLRFGLASDPAQWPYGVSLADGKTRFKLWAPAAEAVELLVISPEPKNARVTQRITQSYLMQPSADGDSYTLERDDMPPGTLYMYRLKSMNGAITQPLPDPRSRFQPEDVHGPSEVVDFGRYQWRATDWKPPTDKRQAVIYKLHVGTFTKDGTFNAAIKELDALKEQGITHVELMPVMEFPGKRNWGYDMVGFYATENAYGRPEDLQRFVDECHQRGLAVLLDTVYNHIGPEGNYHRVFDYNMIGHKPTPWGDAFDPNSPAAVNYITENAEMWARDFRIDGYRFDMTNHIADSLIREVNSRLDAKYPALMRVAEDGRTENKVTLPLNSGGLGYWAKWSFEWHHWVKSMITEKPHMHAYPDMQKLAHILQNGFPEHAAPMNSLHDGVIYDTTHDEIGNHDGKRLGEKVSRQRYMMGSAIKYLFPGMPLVFMGEEYGEKSPFYFFANYSDPVCVNGLREGRKNSPQPDSLEESTFEACKLSRKQDPGINRMNRDLMQLRKTVPALWQGDQREMGIDTRYLASGVIMAHRKGRENADDEAVIVINTSNFDYAGNYNLQFPPGNWNEVFNSEDTRYGNGGHTNAGRSFTGETPINLMGSSISVFRKNKVLSSGPKTNLNANLAHTMPGHVTNVTFHIHPDIFKFNKD